MPDPSALRAYADVVLEVGVALQPGQRLLVAGHRGGAALETAPFVRELVRAAYERGASHVAVLWEDEASRVEQLRRGEGEGFAWPTAAFNELEPGRDATVSLLGGPQLYPGVPTERVAAFDRSRLERTRPFLERITGMRLNWCVVAAPTAAWAEAVFPDDPGGLERLWALVLRCVRADAPDPVAAWQRHLDDLAARSAWLTSLALTAVRFRGGGTELEVGLPEGHRWLAGRVEQDGLRFVPNMPTDELFTLAHRGRAEGVVRLTRPVELHGVLVEGATLELAGGAVVRASAERGGDALEALLATDEGARRLGEIALVPASAPVGLTGIVFRNVLLDENAACHVALGRSYPPTLPGADPRDEAAYAARGGNLSLEHRDLMIGSPETDVDGIAGGRTVPLLRAGEWAFVP